MTAIRSVIGPGEPAISVVVSDNSTNPDDRDRLAEFCALQSSEAVRYVRPPRPLSMPAHWEWLWQLVKREVAATHLAYLTDRMVFAAGALEELLHVVAREPGSVVSYQYDRVDDPATPVDLVQAQWTGQLLELDTRKLLEMSSRVNHGDYLPRMLNSIAPISVLSAIERRFGDVFRPVSPDYRFAYRCLATCDSILYLDRSCLIQYGMARSAGNTYMKGRPNEDAADFARDVAGPRFGATPVPAFETVNNAICQEYCSVRQEVGEDRLPPLDWWSYLAANAISVSMLEDRKWRAGMSDLLERHGWTRSRAARWMVRQFFDVVRYFVRHPGGFARSLRRQLWERPPGTPLGSLLRRAGLNPRVRNELRFESAASAIAYANSHARPRMAFAWHVHQLGRAGAIVRRRAPQDGYESQPAVPARRERMREPTR